jgi:hypothetical protein
MTDLIDDHSPNMQKGPKYERLPKLSIDAGLAEIKELLLSRGIENPKVEYKEEGKQWKVRVIVVDQHQVGTLMNEVKAIVNRIRPYCHIPLWEKYL